MHGQRVATWVDDEERGNGSTIVKIRITKKQLKELLATVESGKLPKQYVLENLLSIGSVRVEEKKRQWRPELARIAEISE